MSDARRPGTETVEWIEAAVAMDRGLRAFADAVRPVLARKGCEGLGLANVLFLLALGSRPASLGEVIRRGRYLGSNASYALKALQRAGLVERRPDERDRRSAVVAATGLGAELIQEIYACVPAARIPAAGIVSAVTLFEEACAASGEG